MFARLFNRIPATVNFRINPVGLDIQASSTDSLLQTALNQGIAFPHNCRAGGCGACKCRLVQGKVKELTDKSYLLTAEELQTGYILACQSLPKSDVVVEVALEKSRPEHLVVETGASIQALKPLTADILEVELKLDSQIAYTAGQYVEVSPSGQALADTAIRRSYSFACAPGEAGEDQVHFYIRKVPGGLFTEWLFNSATAGSRLTVRGPYGNFYLRPGNQPIVAIAGGSGLAPIKAFLSQALRDKKANRDVTLFFGARTSEDLYACGEIADLQRHWIGRFDFVPVLSNEPKSSSWNGRRGLITEHLSDVLGKSVRLHQAYLCGPPPMIDACTEVLARDGIDTNSIFFDKFLDSSHRSST